MQPFCVGGCWEALVLSNLFSLQCSYLLDCIASDHCLCLASLVFSPSEPKGKRADERGWPSAKYHGGGELDVILNI